MNEMSNAPVPESTPGTVLQIWGKALTRPSEQTFSGIASSPNARATTAYLWIFVASLIQIFLAALVQSQLLGTYMAQYGLDPEMFGARSGIAAILTTALCGAPLGAVVTTLVFAISVFVIQWLAKMFGGTGTYDQMAYALASIGAPYAIIVGILTLFSAIPYVGLCFSGILFLAFFYILALQVMAVKGVNQISWGAAIGALLIPILAIGFLCACLIGVSIAALLPVIQETTPNFTP